MLAKRVICVLTFKDGILFRTKKFTADLRYTYSQVDVTLADELCLIDIGEDRQAFYDAIAAVTAECFVPMTIGGRVHTVADVRDLMNRGADKVIVGRSLWENPSEIERMARKFGSQAIVAAVDADGGVARHAGLPVAEAARVAEAAGCGEILLQSVQRDGSLNGYDMPMLREVCEGVTIPVIACSGCGAWNHMEQGFAAGADACGTTCIYHFTLPSLVKCKAHLAGKGFPMRIAA